jgi:hypothetical protein
VGVKFHMARKSCCQKQVMRSLGVPLKDWML